MKLLVINPNTTKVITDIIESRALTVAAPGTEINAVTAQFGASYIQTKEESDTAVGAIQALIDDHRGTFDATVICSSSDSGLREMREHISQPVTAMTESALMVAAMLGRNCCIMVYGSGNTDGMHRRADSYGFGWLVKSVHVPLQFQGGIPENAVKFKQLFIAEGKRAVAEDGTEVIYAGGSAASHITEELTEAIGVPVIEGISCAVKLAEAIAGLK